jgi:hypothetical protein
MQASWLDPLGQSMRQHTGEVISNKEAQVL